MAAPKGPRVARTVGRDAPDARLPERDMGEGRMDKLDPNRPIVSRSGRPVQLTFTGDEDQFDLAKMEIFPPAGWDYQWKVKYVKGREEREAQVRQAQNGWEPVPAERHDGLCMVSGYKGAIERGGMVLMERDERLTFQARRAEKNTADRALAQSHVMSGLMPASALTDFDHPEARKVTFARSERQAFAARDQKGYTYAVDE